MTPRLKPLALAAAALALLAPGTASAAMLGGGAGEYRFQAAPGEFNKVAAYLNDGSLVLYDSGATLTAGAGCQPTASGDGGIECVLGDAKLTRVDVDLGDGGDSFDGTRLRHWYRPHPHGTYDGGDGDDEITHDATGADPERAGVVTLGGTGDDKLTGGGVLDGGPGDDRVRGTTSYFSNDRLEGGDGDDDLDGRSGEDVVNGGPGADTMYEGGDYFQDGLPYDLYDQGTLDGGEGNDRIASGGGPRSTIAGGPGDDEILSAAPVADGGEGNDSLRGGPILRGGPGDDVLVGGARTQPRSYVNVRTDVLDGGPGRDSLRAGGVDATLDGGPDADALAPGDGRDTISYRTRAVPVRIDLRNPGGEGGVDGEGDTIAPGFEKIEGSPGDDEFIAGAEPMVVDGWLGDDVIVGGPGDDTLDGGGHDDVIAGGGGNDKIYGGIDSYTDPESGKTVKAPGFDTIDGGPGGDTLMPRGGEDYVTGGSGDDWIDLRENAGPRPGSTPINYSHIIQMSGADQVWCGKGRDHADGDYADDMATDCETASEGTPRWRSVKVRPGREIRLTVRCAWGDDYPCKGTASFRTASGIPVGDGPFVDHPAYRGAPEGCRNKRTGATLARASFRIRAGRVNYVYLRLGRSTERTVRRRGCLAISALLSFRDAQGREWLATRSLLLKRSG